MMGKLCRFLTLYWTSSTHFFFEKFRHLQNDSGDQLVAEALWQKLRPGRSKEEETIDKTLDLFSNASQGTSHWLR